MKLFKILIVSGLVFAQSDAMMSNIEEEISQGVEQKRIDAYIAKKVHDITNRYDETLRKMLVRGIRIAGQSGNRKANARELSIELGELDQYLLLDLWQGNNIKDAISCIEAISFDFCTLNPQEPRAWEGKFNAYPWDSGKLFKVSNCYNFVYSALGQGGERYKVKLSNKTGGGQFGGIFEILEPKGSDVLVKCYCKAYWGYPAKGNFNSEKAFASSISFVRTSDISNKGPVENDYSPLDLKELFVYKVLELLKLGPKVHFFKVPPIKDGFFIMTEDLSTSDEHFVEMGKMNSALETYIKVVLLDIRNGEFSEYERFNALVGLLEIDTVNRILRLADSNDGNFGFMLKNDLILSSRVKKSDADSWLQQEHNFKIIDFIAPYTQPSYTIDDIFLTFLEGNTVTKYLSGGLMDLAICRHIDGNRDEALLKKNNDEKVFFGQKVVDSLEKRFGNSLKELLKDAANQVVAFVAQGKFKEFPHEVLEQGMVDINNYIEGICQNYSALKYGIMQYNK